MDTEIFEMLDLLEVWLKNDNKETFFRHGVVFTLGNLKEDK